MSFLITPDFKLNLLSLIMLTNGASHCKKCNLNNPCNKGGTSLFKKQYKQMAIPESMFDFFAQMCPFVEHALTNPVISTRPTDCCEFSCTRFLFYPMQGHRVGTRIIKFNIFSIQGQLVKPFCHAHCLNYFSLYFLGNPLYS